MAGNFNTGGRGKATCHRLTRSRGSLLSYTAACAMQLCYMLQIESIHSRDSALLKAEFQFLGHLQMNCILLLLIMMAVLRTSFNILCYQQIM